MPVDLYENMDEDVNNEKKELEKIKKYRCYYPSFMNKHIVNARYGFKYDWVPTSIDSLRLYKVIDSSCICDKNGYNLTHKDEIYKEPHYLYYDTPEQYARHFRVKLTSKSVVAWHEKQKYLFPDGKYSKKGHREWNDNYRN
jgi:hypothetical protein